MKFTRLQRLLAILFLLLLYPAFVIISLDVLPKLREWWNAETNAAIKEFTSEYRKGLEFSSGNDWDSSIASYTRAIELLPESLAKEGNTVRENLATGYYSRGLAYQRKTNSDKALADFTEAIQMSRKLPEAYSGRGHAYSGQGNTEKAEADERKARELFARQLQRHLFPGTPISAPATSPKHATAEPETSDPTPPADE
jgi:tetratricopeptide (TPR) repeat protein